LSSVIIQVAIQAVKMSHIVGDGAHANTDKHG